MEPVLEQVALASALVERFVQFVKPLYQERLEEYQKHIDFGLAALASVGLCAYWQVDVFAAVGYDIGAAGAYLTGGLASLGSQVIHEVVELLKQLRGKGAG